jgi:uncharacterized membrane protein YesL
MIDIFIEIWRINPVAAVFAYIPLLAGMAVWIIFYVRYDWKVLRNLKLAFKESAVSPRALMIAKRQT